MLLHADGFDQYGANAAFSVLNLAQYNNSGAALIANSNTIGLAPPYGIAYMKFTTYQGGIARFVSPVGKNGGQILLCHPALPQFVYWGYRFQRADGTYFLNFLFQPNGTIVISTNQDPTVGGAVIATLPAGYFKTGIFQNWEFVYTPNTGGNNGKAEIYLEGKLRLQVTGLAIADAVTAHYIGCPFILGSSPDACVKSWIIWDSQSAYCNAPLGPRKINTRFANGVGVNNAWAVTGAANAAAATSQVPPNAAIFIQGNNNGDITDLTLPASTVDVISVDGVIIKAYMQKTAATATTAKLGINSGAFTVNSPDITPGIGFSYWDSGFFQTDPATGLPFAKAAYDALGMRVTRSS